MAFIRHSIFQHENGTTLSFGRLALQRVGAQLLVVVAVVVAAFAAFDVDVVVIVFVLHWDDIT